ncbi:MerR family transcriptional regulator [Candidatus Riflebacteria bacterium]
MKENKYFTIRKISHLTSLPSHTIRYYEKQFPDYLKVSRTPGGHRLYKLETLEKLKTIVHLIRTKGFTLKGVKNHLDTYKESLSTTEETIELNDENTPHSNRLSDKQKHEQIEDKIPANSFEEDEETLVQTILRIRREKRNTAKILKSYQKKKRQSLKKE